MGSFTKWYARTMFGTRPLKIIVGHAVKTGPVMINIEASINITKRKWRRKEEVGGLQPCQGRH